MRFIAAIDTIIYGRRYAQGGEIDITGWTRKQLLQFLDKGLMQASQVTAGMIQDAVVFEGADVTTSVDVNGKLHVIVETTAQDLAWLTDVDPTGAADGMVLTYDADTSQWTPRPISAALSYGDLTDVNLAGLADGDIPVWNALEGVWQPGAGPATSMDALTDVDTSSTTATDGDALIWDNSEGVWRPGTASAVPGPTGPVTWSTPAPWSATTPYVIGPPAAVVTYLGSAYVAIANTTGVVPTNTAAWRLIVSKGDKGDVGNVGPASTVPGPTGPANSLAIGTVTTVTNPSPASATITGTAPSQTLNLVIPKGQDGPQGLQGIPGRAIPAGGTLSVLGPVQVATGNLRLYNDTGVTMTIAKVRLALGTAPSGQALIIDVKKDGTTIFPTTAKPQVAVAANTGVATPDVTAWADGSYLTVDVTQVGAPIAGSNLTVTVVVSA